MIISQRKKLRVVQELSRLVPEFSNSTLEVNKFDSSPFVYNPGSTPSTDSVQIFAGTANNIKFAKTLPNTSDLKQLNQNRTSLVDRNSEKIEWEKFKTSRTAACDSNICFHQGLGSTLQWVLNRMDILNRRKGFSHKFIGTIGMRKLRFSQL